MTNYFTNAMIHESGKFQQMFLAKTDHFCSLDKVLDIFKAHPCRSQPVQIQKSLPACSNPIPNSPTSNFDLINSKNKTCDTKNGQINKNQHNNKCGFEINKEEIINNTEEFETENSSNHSDDDSEDDSSNDDICELP